MVTAAASNPIWWVAPTTVIAASTGPAQGTNTRPRLAPSNKPLRELVTRLGVSRGKRSLDEIAEPRDQQARSEDQEHGYTQVAEEILRQAEEAEQRTASEGYDGECKDHAGDDPDRAPAPTSDRSAGRKDRYDRQHTWGQSSDHAGQHADGQQDFHAKILRRSPSGWFSGPVQRASAAGWAFNS